MEVIEDPGITLIEAHPLREEHRCIAMGIQGEDAVVELLSGIKFAPFLYEPLEEGQPLVAEPTRMPLHA